MARKVIDVLKGLIGWELTSEIILIITIIIDCVLEICLTRMHRKLEKKVIVKVLQKKFAVLLVVLVAHIYEITISIFTNCISNLDYMPNSIIPIVLLTSIYRELRNILIRAKKMGAQIPYWILYIFDI